MKLFVSLDVSSEKLDICFMSDDDQLTIFSELFLINDFDETTTIKEQILTFNEALHFFQIVIVMESTSMYRFHPAMLFSEDKEFKALPTVVTVENPFRIKQFSRIFDQDKTGRNDARHISDFFTDSTVYYLAYERIKVSRSLKACENSVSTIWTVGGSQLENPTIGQFYF